VGEIMARDPVTVAPGATLPEIATLMGEKNVHTLPVTDAGGKLLGVVGKRDLIRAMAE
jgi:CBS domain-containing protein